MGVSTRIPFTKQDLSGVILLSWSVAGELFMLWSASVVWSRPVKYEPITVLFDGSLEDGNKEIKTIA